MTGSARAGVVIVELSEAPLIAVAGVRGGAGWADPALASAYRAHLRSQHRALLDRARAVTRRLRLATRLQLLANALAIDVDGDRVSELATLPGVLRVAKPRHYRLDMSTSVPLVGAPMVWNGTETPAARGEGIRVAIIDSGVDVSSPFVTSTALPPAGFPRGDIAFTNGKVIVAKTFLEDRAASPADENGHGTNIASIAAGNPSAASFAGSLSGMAPAALVGNYRAFDAEGSGRTDLIARALEEAFADGFRIANLSFGGRASRRGDRVLLDVIDNATAGGMVVVVAAGNAGPGARTIETPGDAETAITVGSATNAHQFIVTVGATAPAVRDGLSGLAVRPAFGVPRIFPPGEVSYVDASAFPPGSRGCQRFGAGALAGRVVIVERGGCSYRRKLRNVVRAGATAMIVENLPGGRPRGGDAPFEMELIGSPILAVSIGRSGGEALRSFLRAHIDARLHFEPKTVQGIPADALSSFSSRGPTVRFAAKPDLVAPGEAILGGALTTAGSGGIRSADGIAAASGTSQAAAHVTGAAALLRQLRPEWTAEQIKSALMTSAAPLSPEIGVLATGTGRLDVRRAVAVPATISPQSLSIALESQPDGATFADLSLVVTNVLSRAIMLTAEPPTLDGVPVELEWSNAVLPIGGSRTLNLRISTTARVRRGDRAGLVRFGEADGAALLVPLFVRVY